MHPANDQDAGFERGDLVRIQVRLRNGRCSSLAGEVCSVEDGRIVVATVVGVRICRPDELTLWRAVRDHRETSIRRIGPPHDECEEKTLPSA